MLAACLDTCCWWRVLLYAVHVLGCFLGRVHRNSFFCVGVSTGVLLGDSGVSTGVLWCSLVFSGVSIRCRSEVDGRTLTVEKGRRTERDRDGGGAPPKGPRETFQNRVCHVTKKWWGKTKRVTHGAGCCARECLYLCSSFCTHAGTREKCCCAHTGTKEFFLQYSWNQYVYVETCPFTLEQKGMSYGYAATQKNKKAGGGDFETVIVVLKTRRRRKRTRRRRRVGVGISIRVRGGGRLRREGYACNSLLHNFMFLFC